MYSLYRDGSLIILCSNSDLMDMISDSCLSKVNYLARQFIDQISGNLNLPKLLSGYEYSMRPFSGRYDIVLTKKRLIIKNG